MRAKRTLTDSWSTRYRYSKRIPMYIHKFSAPYSKNKWRICKKVNGEVITYGYFKTKKAAIAELERLEL